MANTNCSTGIYNLCINQGATFLRTFVWATGSSCGCDSGCNCSPSTGSLVDLNGYTADMQIRQTVQSGTVLFEASTTNGLIVLGGAAGTIALTIPATDTSGFNWVKGVYDLNLTSSGGITTRLLQGSVLVSPEVTR